MTTRKFLATLLGSTVLLFGASLAHAVETDVYIVRFRTTHDDKDDQDKVVIEIYKDGKRITNANGFGEGETWKDHTDQGPFTIKLNVKADGSKQKIQIKVIKKNSTDGWQFKMSVHAKSGANEVLVLPTTSNTKFEDQTQEKTWNIPK